MLRLPLSRLSLWLSLSLSPSLHGLPRWRPGRSGEGWGGGEGWACWRLAVLTTMHCLCRGLLLARVVRIVRGVSEVVRRGDLRGSSARARSSPGLLLG